MAKKVDTNSVLKSLNEGRTGLKITLRDPQTGEIKDTASSSVDAYLNGWTSDPTLLSIQPNQKVYPLGNGKYSPTPSTTGRVTLDKTTGKVTAYVPEDVKNSPMWESYLEGLKSLSATYQANPNSTFPITDAEGKATGEVRTIDEMLEYLNQIGNSENTQSINTLAEAIRGVRKTGAQAKDYIKTLFNSDVALDFNDSTLATFSGALGVGDEANDSSYVWISDLPALAFLRNLESYNPETGFARKGDILENGWNREKTSDARLDSAIKALEAYFEKGVFKDEEEFLKNVATYQFLVAENAGDNFFSQAARTVGWTLGAFAKGLIDNTANTIEFLLNLTSFEIEIEGDEEALADVEEYTSDSFTNNTIAALTGSNVKDIEDYWRLESIKNSAAQTGIGLGEFGGLIGSEIIKGKLVTAGVSRLLMGFANFASKLAGAANGALAGSKLYQNILTSASIAANSADDLVGLSRAAKTGLWLQTAEGISLLSKLPGGISALAKTYSGLTKLTAALNGAKNVGAGWRLAANMVDQTLDLIGDIASQEPDLLASFIRGEELTDEEKAQLLSTTKATLLFQAAFTGGSKILGSAHGVVKQAHFYKAANANLMRQASAASVKLTKILQTLKLSTIGKIKGIENWDEYIKSIKNAKRRSAMDYDNLILKAKEVIADAESVGYLKTSKAREALKELEEARNNLTALYRARTLAQQEGATYLRRWLYTLEYPELADSWAALQDSTKQIVDAEKRLGLRGYAIGAGAGRTFSQETIDYIGAKSKIPFLENYITRFSGDISKAAIVEEAGKELAVLRGFEEVFLSKADNTLRAAVDRYVEQNKTFWHAFTDLRVSQGISIKDEIDQDRASLLWGEGGKDYARTQRMTKEKNLLILNSDGTFYRRLTTDLDEYQIGATEHFVDPFITQVLALKQAASQRARLDFAMGYVNTMSPKKLISGDDSSLMWDSAQTRAARKTLDAQTNQALEGLLQNFDSSGALNDLFSSSPKANFGRWGNKTESFFSYRANAGGLDTKAIDTLWEANFGDDTSADMLIQTATKSNNELDFSSLDEGTGRVIRAGIDDYRAAQGLPVSEKYTYREYLTAQEYDANFSANVKRSLILNDPEIMDSRLAHQLVDEQVKQVSIFNRSTIYKESLKRLDDALQALPEAYRKTLKGAPELFESLVDDLVEEVYNSSSFKTALESLVAGANAGNDATSARYLILQSLQNHSDDLQGKLTKRITDFIEANLDTTQISVEQQKKLISALTGLMDDVVEAKAGEALTVARGADIHLVDEGDFYARSAKLQEAVQGYKSQADVVAVPDSYGHLEYYQVDPGLNRLMTHGTNRDAMSGLKKINFMWSKAWRFGTTSWRIASMVRQTFTDSYNAIVGGGVYETFRQSKDELTQLFGDHVSEFIGSYLPDTIVGLEKAAGVTVEEALESPTAARKLGEAMADFELSRGQAGALGSSELASYNIGEEGYATRYVNGDGISQGRIASDTALNIRKRFHNLRDGLVNPHDIRESKLRTAVYANNLNAALQNNMSLQQARTVADFMMQEGTTNFTTVLSHLTALGDVTPYLAASINGTKSFYRLLSLDPLGVFGRLVTNAIIPGMAMTAYSLESEENRDVYRRLKEYQKQNNLVFVMNGQVFTIPLPPEIGAFFNPFRQLVEGAYDVQNHTFWELSLNNVAGFSPVDITGFTNPDYNRIAQAAGVWDWFSAGSTRVASQVLPPVFRTAYIAFTRRDPYTGNYIGADNYYWDADTESLQLAGNDSNLMGRLVASVTNGFIDAPLANVLLEGLFGSQVVDIVDTITNWAFIVQGNELAVNPDKPFADMAADAFGSLYVSKQKEQGTAAWRAAVYEAQRIKEGIINSKRWQAYLTAYGQKNKSQEKIEALAAERKDIWQPYYDQVFNMVSKLNELYPEQFTGYKMASAISLMTVDQPGSDASADMNSDLYLQSRQQAIDTMVKMGFPSASGAGVLGRIQRDYNSGDDTGETTKVKQYLPLAFLDMENKLYYSGSTHRESLAAILKQAKLTRESMFEEYNAATTKVEKKKAKAKWNLQVMLAIYPYIKQYTPEAIFKDRQTVDMLDEYLFLDNPYTAKEYLIEVFGR